MFDHILTVPLLSSCNKIDMTVRRTNGDIEAGWKASMNYSVCNCIDETECRKGHARKVEGEWRILLTLSTERISGWRRLSTVYPTGLTDEEAAIWRSKFAAAMDPVWASSQQVLEQYIQGKACTKKLKPLAA